MTLKQCDRCKAKRDVKDEALNGKMITIGKLVRVDKSGTEYWEYSSLETTVCYDRTLMEYMLGAGSPGRDTGRFLIECRD